MAASNGYALLQADARHLPLADASVHCVVTSPPYWGLRDYGTGTWEGGDSACEHEGARLKTRFDYHCSAKQLSNAGSEGESRAYRDTCPACGARRVDDQLGLEALHDCLGWATGTDCGVCYVCHLRQVARELWRVLRLDGTLWLNLGSSYTSGGRAGHGTRVGHKQQTNRGMCGENDPPRPPLPPGLKPKDDAGIPWRVAFALQADGWYLRSDVVWSKANPMPESVADRPTKAHEYVFLLAKRPRYYYDADAIREPHTALDRPPGNKSRIYLDRDPQHHTGEKRRPGQESSFHPVGRNKRSVWSIPTSPYPEAHFATFPEALVEPCILAGTSERGCCPECGAGWERVVERDGCDIEKRRKFGEPSRHGLRGAAASGASNVGRYSGITRHIGWEPGCGCGREDTVPAVVLDPFAGSGTTVAVARRLGRAGIGCDLSAEYLGMAVRRVDAALRGRDIVRAEQAGQLALLLEGRDV